MESDSQVKVVINEGSLAEFQTDAIVNSTNEELILSLGFLSRSILKKAGPQIQAECAAKHPNGLNPEEIAVTAGYGLKCRQVFHGSLPAWDDQNIDAPCKALWSMTAACLLQAHDNNLASVAFPALGCGFLGYPPDVAASTMFQCVAEFNKTFQPSSLNTVYIVILPKGGDWRLVKWFFLREQHGPVGQFKNLPNRKSRDMKHAQLSGSAFSAVLRSFMKPVSGETQPEAMDVSDGPDAQMDEMSSPPKPALKRFSTSIRQHADNCCTNVLPCGHGCLGYKGESNCPPCLQPECHPPGQTAQDDCIICYTDPLMAAPVCVLGCSHVFHLHCVERILENKWIGPRISFNFLLCPICKTSMEHTLLQPLLQPIKEIYDDVSRKALLRAQFENLDKSPEVTTPGSPYHGDVLRLALDRYCYYPCNKCTKAYFGGMAQCGDGLDAGAGVDEAELVCGACSGGRGQEVCPTHNEEFIEYKCRYCCSVAAFFCWGTTHFCDTCHNNVLDVDRLLQEKKLPACPAGPEGVQLTGACPLGIEHPPTGEEMCLGCGLCSNIRSF